MMSLSFLTFFKRFQDLHWVDKGEIFQELHLYVYDLVLVNTQVDCSGAFNSHALSYFLHQALEEVNVDVELIFSIRLLNLYRGAHDDKFDLIEYLDTG